LNDLRALAPGLTGELRGAQATIATAWSAELDAFVRAGGGAVLLQLGAAPGPLATHEMPFWREAVRVVEPHTAWGDFPHGGWAGAQFFGCATDWALELPASAQPILWRLDARTMAAHAYAVELEWGAGRLIVTTLRFEGGAGTQPLGVARNTAAAYLLRCFVASLL
ncbi:MAG: glycoside hydrolase, partial [Chloroflexales bacterium]|nr:glycoside hydrolase [Chloroflexales bacterium]